MFANERFILHEHNAKTAGLHYDLRIKIPNRELLASFALPKAKIPQNPGEKVLAVRTNDHGLYFLNVDHMIIPPGDYGEGEIKSVQKGICEIEGWGKEHITFIIKGEKNTPYFNGRFALIKFKGKKNSDRDNLWVLVKTKKQ